MNVMAKANGGAAHFTPADNPDDVGRMVDDLELLTPEEVAELLKVDAEWVRRAARGPRKRNGRAPLTSRAVPMPSYKVGHYVRFKESEVRDWLKGQKRVVNPKQGGK
jgi:hypothetical protein